MILAAARRELIGVFFFTIFWLSLEAWQWGRVARRCCFGKIFGGA